MRSMLQWCSQKIGSSGDMPLRICPFAPPDDPPVIVCALLCGPLSSSLLNTPYSVFSLMSSMWLCVKSWPEAGLLCSPCPFASARAPLVVIVLGLQLFDCALEGSFQNVTLSFWRS